ncbi:GNAT family N-acetyltransferase [Thalassotalea euphylliae]|uniref:bifunctional helix-turn-helix transcriptional regulator/GNAT family N-acetyltransferase n=1 Tax=Thalassotalea euphylliae TaxID=1655234 RepID=UPI00362B73FD
MTTIDSCIDKVRSFNRFHTSLVGALDEGLLDSDFPLVQVRLMFELANSVNIAAADIVETLSVDRGYLSRMIADLFKKGLIDKTPDPKNNKRIILTLSAKGRKTFSVLNDASSSEVRELLSPLSDLEKDELIAAMDKIRSLLGGKQTERTYVLRDPVPGDMGWIAHRNGKLYWDEYQWDWRFEGLVSKIVGEFAENYDPNYEKCWVAEMDDKIVGSVFLVRHNETTAKLRLLYVEAHARGIGLGRKLVQECISNAKEKGYKRMILWTNSVLTSARKIYQAEGFKLIEEEQHHSYGQDLVGQTWALDL